jgi:hypothetical protein
MWGAERQVELWVVWLFGPASWPCCVDSLDSDLEIHQGLPSADLAALLPLLEVFAFVVLWA